MKENVKMDLKMVLEFTNFRMVPLTMVGGRMAKNMVRDFMILEMEINMMVSIWKEKFMDKVHTFTMMETSTLDNGRMVKNMGMELTFAIMEQDLRENGRRMKNMGKGDIIGKPRTGRKDSGRKGNVKGKQFSTIIKLKTQRKDSTRREKE